MHFEIPDASIPSIIPIAPFQTIVGVDNTFVAVRAEIREIVSCFSYYLAICL